MKPTSKSREGVAAAGFEARAGERGLGAGGREGLEGGRGGRAAEVQGREGQEGGRGGKGVWAHLCWGREAASLCLLQG